MTKLTYEDECYIWASSFYLFETIDEDFFELSDKERYKHLEEYAWEPFEFVDGYTIDGHINELAAHLIDNTYPERNLWQRFTNYLKNKFTYLKVVRYQLAKKKRRKTND